MAKTNMFKIGDKVEWRGEIGSIIRNDKDFRYWVVEFEDYTRILHYEDIELTFAEDKRE
jgi:hypothetical protein